MKKSFILSLVSILLLSGCINSSTDRSEESDTHKPCILARNYCFPTQVVSFNGIEYHYFFKRSFNFEVENTEDELIGYIVSEENRYKYDLDQSKQFYFDNDLYFPNVREECQKTEGAKEVIFINTSTLYPKEELLLGTTLKDDLIDDIATYGSKEFFDKYLPDMEF